MSETSALQSRDHRPPASPVLVLLDATAPSPAVLRRAQAAAEALDARLHILIMQPQLGFTLNTRLLAYAHRRSEAQRQRCLRMIVDTLNARQDATVSSAQYADHRGQRGVRKLVATAVARTGARLVVAADPMRGPLGDRLPAEVLFVNDDGSQLRC